MVVTTTVRPEISLMASKVFLIENGKLTQPVSEMNVTGNLITLWNSLVATGNDPRLNSSWRIPSLVFEGVDFSGL